MSNTKLNANQITTSIPALQQVLNSGNTASNSIYLDGVLWIGLGATDSGVSVNGDTVLKYGSGVLSAKSSNLWGKFEPFSNSKTNIRNSSSTGSINTYISGGTSGNQTLAIQTNSHGRTQMQYNLPLDSDLAVAKLALNSMSEGFLMPRLTSTQRDAMSYVSSGLIIQGGTGYSTATVIISGGGTGATGASASVTVSNGQVSNMVINSRGTGYTTTPTATIIGDGTASTAVLTISLSGHEGLQIYNTDYHYIDVYNGTSWIALAMSDGFGYVAANQGNVINLTGTPQTVTQSITFGGSSASSGIVTAYNGTTNFNSSMYVKDPTGNGLSLQSGTLLHLYDSTGTSQYTIGNGLFGTGLEIGQYPYSNNNFIKVIDKVIVDGDGNYFYKSGGTQSTIPVASSSTLGLIKQGSNVSIDSNGVLSALQINSNVNGSLPLLNVTQMSVFGDSISAAYLASDAFHGWARVLSAQIGVINNFGAYALSGSTVMYSAGQANKYIPVANRNILSTWMSGVNDCRNFGDTPVLYTSISNSVTTFLANAFLGSAVSGASSPKSGTWNNFDTSSWGGKAAYLPSGSLFGSAATASGVTMSISLDFSQDTVVIGTLASDGAVGHELGSFNVYVTHGTYSTLYTTYNPMGRNNGLLNVNGPTAQKWSPDVIVIKGCEESTVSIVTTSNTLTVIDYIGVLNSPQNCAPVIVSQISSIGLSASMGFSTQAVINNANNAITLATQNFNGFPIAVFNPNKYWNTTDPLQSPDGLHGTDLGYLNISRAAFETVQGSSTLYVNPNIDQKINGLTIGQGPSTGGNNYGAVLGFGAMASNTGGSDNVAVGGFAGHGNINGTSNTFLGRQAGFTVNASNGVYVGFNTGASESGGGNTIIGAGLSSKAASGNNNVVIGDGSGRTRIEFNDAGTMYINGPVAATAASIPSTHKIPIIINGVQYYLLASNV